MRAPHSRRRRRSRSRCCGCCAGGCRSARRARRPRRRAARTWRGTATPIVSAKTSSVGPRAGQRVRQARAPGSDRRRPRTGSRSWSRSDGAGAEAAPRARPRSPAAAAADSSTRGVRVASVEASETANGEAHVVEAGGAQALVAALVQDEAAADARRPAFEPASTSSAPAICGTRLGLTKLAASIRRTPAAGRPATSSARTCGRERDGCVLEAVARPDVATSSCAHRRPPRAVPRARARRDRAARSRCPRCGAGLPAPVQRTSPGVPENLRDDAGAAMKLPSSASCCWTQQSRAWNWGSSKTSAIV